MDRQDIRSPSSF